MYASRLRPITARHPRTRPATTSIKGIVPIINIIARPPLRTTHTRHRLPPIKIPRKIHKLHIPHQHITRPRRSPIVTTVLRNHAPSLGTQDLEVGEQHVRNAPPSAAAGLVVGLVVAVAAGDELADPGFDVDSVTDVVLGAAFDEGGVVDPDVCDGSVVEVLA